MKAIEIVDQDFMVIPDGECEKMIGMFVAVPDWYDVKEAVYVFSKGLDFILPKNSQGGFGQIRAITGLSKDQAIESAVEEMLDSGASEEDVAWWENFSSLTQH